MNEVFQTTIDKLAQEFAAARADGKLTVSELTRIVLVALTGMVEIAKTLAVPNAEKKRLVMEAAAYVYNRYITTIPLPYAGYIPGATGLVYAALRPLYLGAVSGAIEFVLPYIAKPSGVAA